MKTAVFKIWRGNATGGGFREYTTGVSEGMVVLDAVNHIQATQANDLAYRWNCKAGKCGSCSAEINGMPKLMCMTRLSDLPLEKPVTVQPMKAFPLVKDLLTNVSWNFRVKKKIKKFNPRPPDAPDGTWRMQQEDIDRVQEFRKCIECFLCQDVCHVLRDHGMHEKFIGPPRWRCIRWTPRIVWRNCGMLTGSVIAISRSVARRFAPKAFILRTTESFP
jgi:succinate dehydrogenase / fumarate reductase iron-sulfur subunit